jgi:hypothetical protein
MSNLLRNIIKQTLKEKLIESIIDPPNIPGTINFWHGGNLDNYDDIIVQRNGRYEFGPGLYLTQNYSVAKKYAKGNRKLYLITIETGNDISDMLLDIDKVIEFVKNHVLSKLQKEILELIYSYNQNNKIRAYIFNNIILNHKAIKASKIHNLRLFYINNNIDYELLNNTLGFNQKMMILYNMKKIVNIIKIKPNDKISVFDLN